MNSYTINELKLHQSASVEKTFYDEDVCLFAGVCGDKNPAHLDEAYAKKTVFQTRIVHGMLVASLFSCILGNDLPGAGSIYTNQTLKFTKPVFLGDTIKASVSVSEIIEEKNRVVFSCEARNQHGDIVLVGEAVIMPPREKMV